VNRVFLSGRIQSGVEVAYTPRGERIVMFPLQVEGGEFSIAVIYAGQSERKDFGQAVGSRVMVAGVLTKMGGRSRDLFKVRANKILWMEE
jgi:primosomal replication protein N